MNKTILLLAVCMFLQFTAAAQTKNQIRKADEQTAAWRYDIESAGVGAQGMVMLKVWSYSKNPQLATDQAKKNAVHGVIFKGVEAHSGAPAKRALVSTDDMANHADFFDKFFSAGGDYMLYVKFTTNSDASEAIRLKNREYKVGVEVTVMYDELRRKLEKEGIVRRLDQGF